LPAIILRKMEKEQLIQSIESFCNEFPSVTADLAVVFQEFQQNYRRKLALQVDNYYIIAILKKELIKKARYKMLGDFALTLKELTKPSERQNSNMPHLKHHPPMSRSYHFRVLCNKGLATQHHRGAYRITEIGWQVLERAYKISKMKPIQDEDYKKYMDVIK